jgi:antitoxin (DNA-binding transcriptional repressor) of toxin-antitoxin stability system
MRRRAVQKDPEATSVTVTEVARNLSDVINRIKYRSEHFLLTKGGLPVAELRPIAAARLVTGRELAGRLATLPHLGADAAAKFADDINEARARMGVIGTGPWD